MLKLKLHKQLAGKFRNSLLCRQQLQNSSLISTQKGSINFQLEEKLDLLIIMNIHVFQYFTERLDKKRLIGASVSF